jgi:hypothetical protein
VLDCLFVDHPFEAHNTRVHAGSLSGTKSQVKLLYKETILENAFVLEDAILEKVTLILKTLLDSIRVY